MDGDEKCKSIKCWIRVYTHDERVLLLRAHMLSSSWIHHKSQTIQLLGINIFTYILGALIIFFISMNVFVGPGWLGQSLGWENVGTFTKVSDSLPLNVDVSKPEYLL